MSAASATVDAKAVERCGSEVAVRDGIDERGPQATRSIVPSGSASDQRVFACAAFFRSSASRAILAVVARFFLSRAPDRLAPIVFPLTFMRRTNGPGCRGCEAYRRA